MSTRAWLGFGMMLAACGGTDLNPLLGEGGSGNDGSMTVDSGGGGMDSGSTDGGGGKDSPTMDAPVDMGIIVSSIGCSDGTREAFISMNTHPNIAGCSGGWSVPGVSTQN